MNIYTGKNMEIKKKTWKLLEIQGDLSNRDICVSLLSKYMIGCEEKDNVTLIYFESEKISEIEHILKYEEVIGDWNWSDVIEENWNSKCEDFFKPVIVNDKVEIIPMWEKSNSDYMTIKINPALAFGTGHHETTYMMIEAILNLNICNKSIVDIGTGSGILSILLNMMGNENIFAIDNDSLVESNFYENLDLNNIDNIDFEITDCLKIREFNYDVILANINREIILELLELLKNTKNLIILSGILIEDSEVVESSLLKNNKSIIQTYTKNEWKCIIAQ